MCKDCGLAYDDYGGDTTLPNNQWSDITKKDDASILCANCMVKRASELPGFIAARMVFDFAPIKDKELNDFEGEVMRLKKLVQAEVAEHSARGELVTNSQMIFWDDYIKAVAKVEELERNKNDSI